MKKRSYYRLKWRRTTLVAYPIPLVIIIFTNGAEVRNIKVGTHKRGGEKFPPFSFALLYTNRNQKSNIMETRKIILKVLIVITIFSSLITFLECWGAVWSALTQFAGFVLIMGTLVLIGYGLSKVFK